MSSPITSVPEPGSSDTLAGIITQVSPGQSAPGLRAAPARPVKVKQTTDGKVKKKKKSTATATAAVAVAVAGARSDDPAPKAQQEAKEAAAALPSEVAAAAAAKATSHTAGTAPASTDAHTKDTAAATAVVAPAASTLAAADANPTVTASEIDAANTLVASDAEKAAKVNEAAPPTTSSTTKPTSAAQLGSTKPVKKRGALSKLIALLTCSGGATAVVASERLNENKASSSATTEKTSLAATPGGGGNGAKSVSTPTKKSASGAGKLALPVRTTPSRSPSRRSSLERGASLGTATPGGGTKLPREETGDVMSGAVVPPGASFVTRDADETTPTPSPSKRGLAAVHAVGDESEEEDDEEDEMGDYVDDEEEHNEELRLIMQGGIGIPRDENGKECPLLGPIIAQDTGRKCLVLDLDETLVHSSFKMIQNADFIVPVEIEGTVHSVYVIKRPGVDEFMRRMGEIYEVVVFTASLSKYADPVLDILDIHRVVRHRLFRESCYNHKGNYVKDLSQLGREIGDSIIIDNSPASYIFHPKNAVPISSWFNDPHDTELTDLCPFLADLCEVDDVRAVLDGSL